MGYPKKENECPYLLQTFGVDIELGHKDRNGI